MRTITFILSGFALLATSFGLARLLFASVAESPRWAMAIFVAVWLVIAGANLWLGVTRAGYTVWQELPIFLLIFGLPAVAAGYVFWKFN